MNYKIGIRENIVVINSKTSLSLDEIKEIIEGLPGNHKYGIATNSLGYWKGYDLEKNCSIYCGTMSEKTSIEQIKEYINGKI
jgi:hypothetical protein